MIVVDTNVMVYLLTGSGRGDRAANLLMEDPEWAAPPILISELQNVLLEILRTGRLSSADAVEICDDAHAVLSHRVATVPSAQVLDTAIECDLSAHDAEFVVLARRLGAKLVTADEGILAGAPDVAVAL
jgi:predicted nucleic acid-binding protein